MSLIPYRMQIIAFVMACMLGAGSARAELVVYWYFGTDSGGFGHDPSRVTDGVGTPLGCGKGVQFLWAGPDGTIDPPGGDCSPGGDDAFVLDATLPTPNELNTFGAWSSGTNDGVCDGVWFLVPDKTGRFCRSDTLQYVEADGDPVDWNGRQVYVRAFDGASCGSSTHYGDSGVFAISGITEPGGTVVWRKNFGPFEADLTFPPPTPTPYPTPSISAIHRDKRVPGVQHLSDWVDVTFVSAIGVTYDILSSASMQSPSWTPQGSILATGGTTTYRDPGPVFANRFYRVAVQGAVPAVTSPNEAGVIKTTVLGKSVIEAAQGGMVGISLDSTEDPETIQEVLGWQTEGSANPDLAAEVWAFGPLASAYEFAWLFDSGGTTPSMDGQWINPNLGAPSVMAMPPGSGFWVYSKSDATQEILEDGMVLDAEFIRTVYVNATRVTGHQMGQAFAGSTSLDEASTTLLEDGAKGSTDPDSADEIWLYQQATDQYEFAWLYDSGGSVPSMDGVWIDPNRGEPSTMAFEPGRAWWYYSRQDPSRVPSWTWTCPVSY